jgi:hypothetical protein
VEEAEEGRESLMLLKKELDDLDSVIGSLARAQRPALFFGFSIGDFIAVTSLIVSIIQALRGISDDLFDVKELQHELNHMQSIFEQMENKFSNSITISGQNVERFQQTFSRCLDFKRFLERYG